MLKLEAIESASQDSDSTANCMRLIEALKLDAAEAEKPIIQTCLHACLDELKRTYWPHLLRDETLKELEQSVELLEQNFAQLVNTADAKLTELNGVNECGAKCVQYKAQIETWLHTVEAKLSQSEPSSIELPVVENQCAQLDALVKEHELKSADLTELNTCSNTYAALIAAKQQPNESLLATKLNCINNNSSNSRSSSCDNLNSSFENNNTNSTNESNSSIQTSSNSSLLNFPNSIGNLVAADLTQEVTKLNQLFEWTGERLDERKRQLFDSLASIKSLWDDMNQIDSSLDKVDLNLKQLFGLSSFEKPVKLPLDINRLNKLADDSDSLMSNSLGSNIESVQLKANQLLFEQLPNDTNGLDEVRQHIEQLNAKHFNLNQHQQALMIKLNNFLHTLKEYEADYAELQASLNLKQTGVKEMMSRKEVRVDLTQADVGRVEGLKEEFYKKDAPLLDHLNELGQHLIQHMTPEYITEFKKLDLVNAEFTAVSSKLGETLLFKQKMQKHLVAYIGSQENVLAKIDQVNARLGKLSDLTNISNKAEAQAGLDELENIEAAQLIECNQVVEHILG